MKLSAIERSEYSQNGEDGIIEHLLRGVREPEHTFVEIGCGDGSQNNTSYLADQGYRGVVFDRKQSRIAKYRQRAMERGWLVEAECRRVTPGDVPFMKYNRADLFSLDIDSVDWWVCRALLDQGFWPKVMCLEYNAAFGERPVTVPPNRVSNANKLLYFGAGVVAWRRLLEPRGYRFVTVENSGVNCFFIDPREVDEGVLEDVKWRSWRDCARLTARYGPPEQRYAQIRDLPLKWV